MIVKSVKYLYLERMSETKNEIYGKQIRCLNGKKGKVGIIEGSQGTDPQIYRTQTFLEYLSSYLDVKLWGLKKPTGPGQKQVWQHPDFFPRIRISMYFTAMTAIWHWEFMIC